MRNAYTTVTLIMHPGGGKGFTSKTHIFDWPEGTAIWRKYAKLRMQLFPYIYTQAHTAHEVSLQTGVRRASLQTCRYFC